MKTSAAGRALIEQREGRRLTAYRDTKYILTIGVGHTGLMSKPPVTAGMTISDAQCDEMLAHDLAPVEAVINGIVRVPMSQNEFDALASLGFNIGAGGLKRSTVLKRLNCGDVAGAAEAFGMWDHPAVLAGRRRAEAAQFLTPDPPGAGGVSRTQVASARAATLATMAEAAKARAYAARSSAAALVVASATTAVSGRSQHPSLAVLAGGLVLAAVGAALVAIFSGRMAQTLAANAGHQADAVAGLGTPSTDLVDRLQH